MGGDVQQVAAPGLGEAGEQTDVDLLDDPGGGGLQVVQEDLGHGGLVQGRGGLPGELPRRHGPQQGQRGAAGAVHVPQGVEHDVLGGDGRAQPAQQQHRRRAHRHVLPLRQVLGEQEQIVALAVRQHLHRQGRGGLQQLEGGLVLQPLRPPVPAQKDGEKLPPPVPLALVQQGVDHHLQGEADPAPVLGQQLVVRADDLLQIELPLVHVRDGAALRGPAGGALLGVAGVEAGDDLPHEGRRLAADVPLPVHEQLVEKGQGLHLLGGAEVDGVGLEHAQVGPQAAPVRLPPGQLQKTREAALAREAAHKGRVVLHAQKPQLLQRLPLVHEGNILLGPGVGAGPGEAHVHPQAHHPALEVPQLGVDEGVAGALGLGDVVELAEDDVKGLLQGGDAGDLPAVGAPLLLDPEVGVDERQALRRQVVQLQIPHRVVGGHVADVPHVPPAEPQIRVVVVEVGHPLPWPAAEFADVVARRAGGDQPQIHRNPGSLQAPGRVHGHVVDPGDVLQRPPGGGLQPQAHHLVDVLPPVGAQKQAVAVPVGALLLLVLLQQLQLPQGVRRQQGALRIEEHLEQGEEERRPRPVLPLPGRKGRLGEHGPAGEVVGEGDPPLLRLRGEQGQLLPAQGEHVGAPDALLPEEGGEALEPALLLQQLCQHGPVGGQVAGRRLGGHPAQQAGGHLADAFFVHGVVPPVL